MFFYLFYLFYFLIYYHCQGIFFYILVIPNGFERIKIALLIYRFVRLSDFSLPSFPHMLFSRFFWGSFYSFLSLSFSSQTCPLSLYTHVLPHPLIFSFISLTWWFLSPLLSFPSLTSLFFSLTYYFLHTRHFLSLSFFFLRILFSSLTCSFLSLDFRLSSYDLTFSFFPNLYLFALIFFNIRLTYTVASIH